MVVSVVRGMARGGDELRGSAKPREGYEPMSEKITVTINGEEFPVRDMDIDFDEPDINDRTSRREIHVVLHGVMGIVPKDDVRELVGKLRERAEYDAMEAVGLRIAADELEKLVEDSESAGEGGPGSQDTAR